MPWKRTEPESQVKIVQRPAADLPQTAQVAYFTATGKVRITGIIGEVTEIIENQATNLKLVSNPTVGADVDLCAELDIANDAVGTMYTITGTWADTMIATTSGAIQAGENLAGPIDIAPGTIDVVTDEDSTGKTKWTIHYIPIDDGARIIPA